MEATRKKFSWEKGSVVFELPSGWRSAREESAISFSAPTGDVALTITIHTDPRLSPADIDRLISEKKPFGLPRTEKKEFLFSDGFGFTQEFLRKAGDSERVFLTRFLFCQNATVIASVNGEPAAVDHGRSGFAQILGTIRVQTDPE